MVTGQLIVSLSMLFALGLCREQLVPSLEFNATACYRRDQICCYRYTVQGRFCKQNLCTYTVYCANTKGKYCAKHRQIRTCQVRCYHRMRPVYECTPNELKVGKDFVDPKEYLKYLDTPAEVRVMN